MSVSIRHRGRDAHGLFHGDPLAVVAGNLSPARRRVDAPQDSFMVYVGAPVNDAACVYSDGVTRPCTTSSGAGSRGSQDLRLGRQFTTKIFQKAGNSPADTLTRRPRRPRGRS